MIMNTNHVGRGTWRIGRTPDCLTSHAGVLGTNPADPTSVISISNFFSFFLAEVDYHDQQFQKGENIHW